MTAKRAKQLLRSLKGLPLSIQEINALHVIVRYLSDTGHADLAEEFSTVQNRVWIARMGGPELQEKAKGTDLEP